MIRNAAQETCPKFIRPRGLASCSFYSLDGEETFLEKGGKKIHREESSVFLFFSFFFLPEEASFRGKKPRRVLGSRMVRAGTPPEFSRRIRTGLLTTLIRFSPLSSRPESSSFAEFHRDAEVPVLFRQYSQTLR